MHGFIYITTNLITGKKYLGKKRYDAHSENYLGSCKLLKEDIKTLGRINFSRQEIDYAVDAKELKRKEASYIKKFQCVASPDWYNLSTGYGTLGFSGKTHSEETKAKMRKSYKRVLTEDGKKRIADATIRDKRWLKAASARKECTGAKHNRSIPIIVDGVCYESRNIAFKALKGQYTLYRLQQMAKDQENSPKHPSDLRTC